MTTLEADLQSTIDQLNSTKDELSQYKSENRGLLEEMKVINEVKKTEAYKITVNLMCPSHLISAIQSVVNGI